MQTYRFSFEPHELPAPLRDFSATVHEPITQNTLSNALGPVVARSMTAKKNKGWHMAINADGTGVIVLNEKATDEIHFKYGREA